MTSALRTFETRSTRKRNPARAFFDIGLIIVGLLMVMPIAWMIITSVTPPLKAFVLPPNWLPWPITVGNFAAIPGLIPFFQMALNSLTISVIAMVGAVFTSSIAGYAFSRLKFAGKERIFIVLLGGLMVPAQLTVVPLFIIMKNLGLIDTLPSVWLPTLINVFGIFFMRQYFASIPRELDEAMKLDGAGHFRILFRLILPLSKPAISALAILVFESSWNGFFWPLIFLNSPDKMTLPVGLVMLQDSRSGTPAVVVLAAVAAVVLPLLIAFFFFQKSFVSSVATAGIKG
jgi:multiple sugar transport system permease protein